MTWPTVSGAKTMLQTARARDAARLHTGRPQVVWPAQLLTRDPGYWVAEATLSTQFTGAHPWVFRERVPVYLKDTTLIQ